MYSLQIVFGVAIMAVACAAVEYAPVVAYHHAEPAEHYAPPKYSFEYAVKDEHTGDIKSQHETREGDSVKGYYTLVQPDGKKRIVEYTSEHKDGFNAIVHYEGEAKAYAPAPKYAPAPVYKYVAPAPVYKYEAPAPVYKYVAPAPVYKYEAPAPVYKYSAPSYSAPKYEPKYAAYTTTSFQTPHFSYKF